MKAEELIKDNALQNFEVVGEQKIVFEEIALAAIKMARIEISGEAIEEFTRFVKEYCNEADHFEITKTPEHYIEVFKKQLKNKI